jgi:predicted aconitase
MQLKPREKDMLDGVEGKATQKAMEILVTLGTIYGAERMIPVTSVQIAGVSYDNLGDAGLHFLGQMADDGGRARVLTTLNPAGMDIEIWENLGISAEFAANQERVIQTFARMNVVTTCTCTPYLSGNVPLYSKHIAWSESSAVCYANSVIGARTNREGGPSALAASITSVTPEYGYHLTTNRQPSVTVHVNSKLEDNSHFGGLGKAIGEKLGTTGKLPIPYILGVPDATMENLKSLCASIATYGGVALFHMQGITPEAATVNVPEDVLTIDQGELDAAISSMIDTTSDEVDFVSLGCPHLSIGEVARIAELLKGKRVTKEFWITTARPTKQIADRMGYSKIIQEAGAIIAADTCCVVAPIKGRFNALATDSAKACYYASGKNQFKTLIKPFDEVVQEALK